MSAKNLLLINQPIEVHLIAQEAQLPVMEAEHNLEGIRKIIRYRPDLVIANVDEIEFGGLVMMHVLNLIQICPSVILIFEKKAPEGLKEEFANILNILPRAELGAQLPSLLAQPLPRNKPTDYPYHLKEHEWCSLLSAKTKTRILVAEDSTWFRKLNLMLLDQTEQYHLFSATDGMDAILKALLIRPDLILADVSMPGVDGVEMSQLLYIIDQPFPILFLTALQDQESQRRAKNIEGVLGFVDKTLLRDPKAFIAQIEWALKMARTLKSSFEATFEKGQMDALMRPGKDRGIFLPGSGFMSIGSRYSPGTFLESRIAQKKAKLAKGS
ncbi:MAG: hypothetical protein A2527_07910 [Candidatus Lambdaproteobacteria bacterium RIFOXYD2_FULL_50_16]|uniref:Response regulatory domain-containing protein n=1 Tax=Candidatus Lambdaproteobacteria bacterium RIFOXYD2_FULL_50_16 TaxID=1817772 RepID=A0A1F6GAF8_9PROT|nr:MAG: hypothetical protein A2527_07910 [Candidatus Lambdaproteobacteria bacterium RIFOXYD2_FULL_50_16]